jgi:DNA polymerase I-like protein with 3'-5' exonuclease and polymerase domains
MSLIAIDIETNLAHDTIWCLSYHDGENTGTVYDALAARNLLKQYDKVVAHNGIGFDYPVLAKVWGYDCEAENTTKDTLVLSRLYRPTINGGHSLKLWGKRLKFEKMDFDVEDFDGGLTDEMVEYCERDAEVCYKLYQYLDSKTKDWTAAVPLEHQVARICAKQERNGFKLDVQEAMLLQAEVQDRMWSIESSLQSIFPPIVTERYSEKTGKRLKDKVEEFNVGSRQQIAKRLKTLGWKPTKFTPAGQAIVDEGTLDGVDIPEAKVINEYLMLQKRDGLLKSWLKNCKSDGRVHGRVNTNGAVTGRMTHSSPNMGQIPSVSKPYGERCRKLWTVESGNKLVGSDLSGIELRCLAHYMQDDEYTDTILNGDIHTKNQEAAGLPTRNNAKTFIYAFLYGAGAAKIGSIVDGSVKEGQQLIDNFLREVPKLAKLKSKITRLMTKHDNNLPALDGRLLEVRSEHSALNTLLQSAGAVVAKQWLVEIHNQLDAEGIEIKQVAMVHDEVQIECAEEVAQRVADICVEAAERAGKVLGMRCPVAAEADIGINWYDTH